MSTDLVEDEGSLARLLVHRWQLGFGDYFGKVTQIPRGKRIGPDIDLLRVYSSANRSETVAYELKVLRYNSRIKTIPVTPFYTGLSEVLCYFRHGVDRAELVLGFHPNCAGHAERTERLIKETCDFLRSRLLQSFPFVRVYSVRDGQRHLLLQSESWDRATFSHDDEGKHKRQCLIRNEFTCEEKYKSEH
jgi:hypothetical protein